MGPDDPVTTWLPTDRGDRMSTPTPDRPQWSVTVTVPADLPGGDRVALADRIAAVAHDWEPAERDGWDVDVSAGPTASAPQGDTADVIEHARRVLADSYDGIDPDVETRHDGAVANLAAAGLFAVAASPVAPVMQPTHIQAADELDRGAAQLADVADITQSRSAYGYGYRIAYERIVDWLRHEFVPPAPAPADDEAAQVERMAAAIAKDDGFDWRSGEWNDVYLSRARAALAELKRGQKA